MGDQIHKIHYFLIPSEWSMYFFYENILFEIFRGIQFFATSFTDYREATRNQKVNY